MLRVSPMHRAYGRKAGNATCPDALASARGVLFVLACFQSCYTFPFLAARYRAFARRSPAFGQIQPSAFAFRHAQQPLRGWCALYARYSVELNQVSFSNAQNVQNRSTLGLSAGYRSGQCLSADRHDCRAAQE
jgi:hypothetical protein